MISACTVPTVKHEKRDVIVCFAGDRVGDLYQVQDNLNQHGYPSIIQGHAIQSGLWVVGTVINSPSR